MLWFFIALMIVTALVIILLPLVRTAKDHAENRREQNIHIAQDQLIKLKEDKQQGVINQQEYDLARSDLEKTLYSDLAVQTSEVSVDSGTDYTMSSILVVLVPITVIALYYLLGSPSFVTMQQTNEQSTSVSVERDTNGKVGDISSMFESLQQRLKQNPDDVRGWMMMGLTYMHYEQFEQALAAYQKADTLLPNDSDIQLALDRAEKAISSNKNTELPDNIEKKMVAPNGQTIDVGAMVMRLRAKLEANPDNLQGWLMLGRSYSNLGRYADAVYAYQKALSLKPSDVEIMALLEKAKSMM